MMKKRTERILLIAVVALYIAPATIGQNWGLPSRDIDPLLFHDQSWSGERIMALAGTDTKLDDDTRRHTGADVDADPTPVAAVYPVRLNGNEKDTADILLRYRLYTHQPDEMITMMALAGMRPARLEFDPRLYQYGGLFIYPVGALLKAADLVGLVDLRSDLRYYLDQPEQFGRFYIIARAYTALWGLVGVLAVFAVARQLHGPAAGLLAAALFAVMPVVICMSHEAKPHLPGAVLMLLAVLFAIRLTGGVAANPRKERVWLWMACGAAVGMVLSSWPILVLVPLSAWLEPGRGAGSARPIGRMVGQTFAGAAVAVLVYALTNPYVPINTFVNREVLESNFGNSLAMYQVSRIGEGLLTVIDLTVEGAGLPLVLVGLAGAAWLAHRRRAAAMPLIVPAVLFFFQFVLIGAGKPAEYGRFGIFTNAALAIAASILIVTPARRAPAWLRASVGTVACLWVSLLGLNYLLNFCADSRPGGSRHRAAERLREDFPDHDLAVLADPAPYSCPPVQFDRRSVHKFGSLDNFRGAGGNHVMVIPVDRLDRSGSSAEGQSGWSAWWSRLRRRPTRISWANKPMQFHLPATDR